MVEIFDIEAWREVVVGSLSELGSTVAGFLPNLVGAVLILVIGWIVSRLVEAIASRGLRQLGFDRASGRLGLGDTLARAGIERPPSQILALLFFWILMLTFLLSAVETLGLTAVTATINRLIGYLPNVIGAALITVIGLLLGRFVGSVVSSGAAAADLAQSSRLGGAANSAVVVVVVVLALQQLGVDTGILITVTTALVGALGISLGLAFALGARPLITHILAGHFLRQRLPSGLGVEVQGQRGIVERVGAVDTLLRADDRAWSIPNAKLLDEVVLR